MIKIRLWWNHECHEIETMYDENMETLSMQIQSLTGLEPQMQILLVEGRSMPLDSEKSLRDYGVKENQWVVVLGTNVVAADPNQKLSEAAIARFSLPQRYPVGIKNEGNLCYLISALQYLYSCPAIRSYILENPMEGNPLLSRVHRVFKELQERPESAPQILGLAAELGKQSAEFANLKEQHDSQEALDVLIGKLVDAGMPNLFQFSQAGDIARFLQLNIKAEYTSMDEAIVNTIGDRKIEDAPQLLQLHLLRYSIDPETNKPLKINRKLAFQDTLTLKQALRDGAPSPTYKLQAIIAHKGVETTSGHYVCYARHGDKWFCFDDAQSALIDDEALFALAGGVSYTFIGYVFLYVAE